MDALIADFLRRSRSRYTADHVKQALSDNLSIVTEDGFICFNVVQDECYILFFYVRPGVDAKPFLSAVEFHAKANNCTVMRFVTQRDKAFARRFKDYHTAGTLFEKAL
jgi:hypothetical protein